MAHSRVSYHDRFRDACIQWLWLQPGVKAWPNDTGKHVMPHLDGQGERRWRVTKSYGTKGVPDILGRRTVKATVWVPAPAAVFGTLVEAPARGWGHRDGVIAQMLAIDVKIGRDRVSPAQTAFLDDLRAAGGIAFVVRCTDPRDPRACQAAMDQLEALWKEAIS